MVNSLKVLKRKIKNTENTVQRKLDNTINRVENTLDQAYNGQSKYPLNVQKIINKYGNLVVENYTLKRSPVASAIVSLINIISLGSIQKKINRSNYDTLFHLFIEFKINDTLKINLEKNERMNMTVNEKYRENTQSKEILNTESKTINEILENTRLYMGDLFYTYSASQNNCQDFIASIIKSNNIGDQTDLEFIKQDTETLFKNKSYLSKISDTVTNLAGSSNTIFSGGKISKKKVIKTLKTKIAPAIIKGVTSGIIQATLTAITDPIVGLTVGKELGDIAGDKLSKKITGYGIKPKKINSWIEEVKAVQKDKGITYKEALKIASQNRKKN